MARTGPPRQPTALKIIAGNPGKRKLPVNEAKPAIEAPDPPSHLLPTALEEWHRLVPLLLRLGLLTKLDRAALAGYCQWWARHVQAEEELAKCSMMKPCKTGYETVSQWFTISKHSYDMASKMIQEFGLTPSARARIPAQAPPPPDDAKGQDQKFKF